jgi:diadenosine tetraphosphate (Ap4A) HIT family hydrolase
MVSSLIDLARRIDAPEFSVVRRLYDVSLHLPPTLWMDELGWARATQAFGAARHELADQELVYVRCRYRGLEAVLNDLRGGPTAAEAVDPAALIDEQRRLHGCWWCNPQELHVCRATRCREEIAGSISADGRFATRPNWGRSAFISALIYGDENAHNLFRLGRLEFVALFDLGSRQVEKYARAKLDVKYFALFLNGGAGSAGRVPHAHVQIIGRRDRHFGWAENIVRNCPPDFWRLTQSVHESLGLAFRRQGCVGWVSLCPAADKEITLLSPDIPSGAAAMFDILQALMRHGTTSFSLAVTVSPCAAGMSRPDERFAAWPAVVWRIADRGDIRAPHADIGAMELLIGTTCFAADPWLVAGCLGGVGRSHDEEHRE